MTRTVYVNGEFVAEDQAKVSVFDRGFLFADAVYEVTAVLDGKLIDNEGHIQRLHRSLGELGINAPATDTEIIAAQKKLIALNGLTEGGIYLQVSRGVADRNFAYSTDLQSTLVMFTQENNLVSPALAATGLSVISVPDIRWKRRDIKTVGLLAQSLAKQSALDAGANDAWMVEDGYVTEGSSNNAFIVDQQGVIITRQLGSEILHGITRAAVLKLLKVKNLELLERPFTIDEALNAREAFSTSASTFVYPVVSIDGHPIGNGKPGPIATELRQVYLQTALQSAS